MREGTLQTRELKSYKGFRIFKTWEIAINAWNREVQTNILYMADWEDGDNFDCKSTIKELKKSIDNYLK